MVHSRRKMNSVSISVGQAAAAQRSFHTPLPGQLSKLSRLLLFEPQDNYRSVFRDHNATGMLHLQMTHDCCEPALKLDISSPLASCWLSRRQALIKVSLPYLKWGNLEHYPPGTGLCFSDRNGAKQIWPVRLWPGKGLSITSCTSVLCGTHASWSWQSTAPCSGNILLLPGTPDSCKRFHSQWERSLK